MSSDHHSDAERDRNLALLDEVERFAAEERGRLSDKRVEVRFQRSPHHWLKSSAHLTLERLPYATADLSVWDTGETELGAAWGQRPNGWDKTMQNHLDLGSVDEVRLALARLVSLVLVDRAPAEHT